MDDLLTHCESPPDLLDWRNQLRLGLRTAPDLVRAALIGPEQESAYEGLLERYQFLITPYYASLIDRSDPACPIRLQAIPALEELTRGIGMEADPLQDLTHRPVSRITHRYGNRVLLHLTPNCSMYCRFCFRKTLLNEGRDELFAGGWREALDYVAMDSQVEEVIFSGGDPLLLSDGALGEAMNSVRGIRHIERIRLHTRVPVTLPQRITPELCTRLFRDRNDSVCVVHFNHPREWTEESLVAVKRLKDAGWLLLNQSVLLKGVNDTLAVQVELQKRCMNAGVLPYYLHHPDAAEGTSHFSVSMEEGGKLHRAMRIALPGYLVPRYVKDDLRYPYKSFVVEGEF